MSCVCLSEDYICNYIPKKKDISANKQGCFSLNSNLFFKEPQSVSLCDWEKWSLVLPLT